ncbi:unnamed protein product [Ilex paraguariensis]|uniref:S-protein homolog n=2 Tax=Ilex paraguariensis TaxID=185542 RepID=A0ABC8T5A7_9AQUA
MATTLHCPILLALVFYLSTTSFAGDSAVVARPVVHIISAMNKNTAPINLRCKVNGAVKILHALNAGEDYQWSAAENDVYYCDVIWDRWFAAWHGFEPKRDQGQETIFWKVNKDGFFFSWDRSRWEKKFSWETD